ncbi:MAG TPA: sigma-54 dependent transcriptional regulator [Polyangiaceae bacterium]|nr:sigma-54 dependent transcriptional regulator [Polyangiaceae bacterium]
MAQVLVVDDEPGVRWALEGLLRDLGHEVETALDGVAALERLRRGGLDLCLLDMGLPGLDGMGVLRGLGQLGGDQADRPLVIVVSGRDDMGSTVEAVRLGAYDYLLKPFDLDRLRLTMARALEQRATSRALARFIAEEKQAFSTHQLVGRSEAIREVFKTVGAVGPTRAAVLVRGESGTGKELVARALHFASERGVEPFVAVNCSAFARDLLESELFGHVRGAFTGAVGDKAGRLQLAGKGTLFLDEVGELPLELQAKLLRVLQERTFERVGDARPQKLEARVVAATHRDLGRMVAEGSFREDLYYRLKVVEIVLPPLRERPGDIPLLVEHLLGKLRRELGVQVRSIDEGAMRLLVGYPWPGNVRELENALTRACVLARGEVVTAAHFDIGDVPAGGGSPSGGASAEGAGAEAAPPAVLVPLRDLERWHIARVLEHTRWNKRRACAILEIARPTLDRKIREYDLERSRRGAGGVRRD